MMKTALITGASSGMGLEFAKILAREGYYLVLVARRENLLENLRTNLLSKHKIKVTIICLDLSVRENSEKLYKTVIEKGIKVDLLINNAGFGDFGEFVETNYKKKDRKSVV